MSDRWKRSAASDAEDLALRVAALTLPVVPVRRHAYLGLPLPLQAGWSRTAAAVGFGPRDDAIALWRRRDGTAGAIVRHVDGDHAADVRELPSVDGTVRGVQPLSDGRTAVLVDGPIEPDLGLPGTRLLVLDADGREVANADVGPDTCALTATADDSLWLGFSDIGSYARHPVARQGLARFDASLSTTVSYHVSDLAFLNVTDRVVHAAGYACTELLRITEGNAESIPSTELSYGTLLVDGGRAVLVGAGWKMVTLKDATLPPIGHGTWTAHDVAVPVSVAADGMRVMGRRVRLVAPDGRELPGIRARTGRGPHLNVVADYGREWWRLDLDDLPFWG